LQVSLTKRFSHGIQFLGSYTFGKSLTTVNTNSGLGDNLDVFTSGAQDNYNIRGDGYGPANFDRTHRVVISYIYDVPAVRGSGILAKIFSGWRTSGIIIAQSGLPFSITDSLGERFTELTAHVPASRLARLSRPRSFPVMSSPARLATSTQPLSRSLLLYRRADR